MENPWVITLIVSGLILFLLAAGTAISMALGLVGFGVLFFLVGGGLEGMIGRLQYNMTDNFIITALPLFVFMGEIILHSGAGEKLYKGLTAWVSFLPGGLLHTNIASCAVFAAVSGSSIVTAATIGMVAIPELEKRGYNRRLVYGSLAGGGTLGILIPPSVIMVIYGAFVSESIGKLFIGGIFPGLILAGLFMTYIGAVSVLRPKMAVERLKPSLRAMGSSTLEIFPTLVLIFMVLGTIYLGLAGPTEAAAMGAFGALVICALYRKLTWQVLKVSTLGALKITSWVWLIAIGAMIVSMSLSMLKVPEQLALEIASLELSRLGILTIIVIFYIILGCFVDAIAMMLLTLPVMYPLMMALGFDSVWFGIMMVVFIEMGQITPPVGVNLYVIHGITGKKHFKDIVIGVVPFFLCQIVLIVLLTAFPSLVTWLPSKMFKPWGYGRGR